MQFRKDIQSLRGIAVLLVVLYHAKIPGLVGGYLGVDVFFVISGFLITGQIHRELQNREFIIREFYLRRVWRLLPAAYSVFFACCLVAPWVLTRSELLDFRDQLIGAVAFVSNIVLWNQAGYFENAAEYKFLLHTWSLSIEEQYYLLVPILLALVSARRRLLLVVVLSLLSFAVMIYFSSRAPGATFYLTPTRIWALGVGSFIALIRPVDYKNQELLGSVALVVVLIVSTIYLLPTVVGFNEASNLVVTLSTAVLIVFPCGLLSKGKISDVLAWFGGFSYSLYLVHWPLFAVLSIVTVKDNSDLSLRILVIIVSVLLALLLNKHVEQRFRITRQSRGKKFTPMLVCSAVLVVLALSISMFGKSINYDKIFAANFGLSKHCNTIDAVDKPDCMTSPRPLVLLWGDSFAMHLALALKADESASFLQLSRSECAPIVTLTLHSPSRRSRTEELSCLEFNQSVLEFVKRSDTIGTVVLASPWGYLLSEKLSLVDNTNLSVGEFRAVDREVVEPSLVIVFERLNLMIKDLRSAGKKVIFINPPPSADFSILRLKV